MEEVYLDFFDIRTDYLKTNLKVVTYMLIFVAQKPKQALQLSNLWLFCNEYLTIFSHFLKNLLEDSLSNFNDLAVAFTLLHSKLRLIETAVGRSFCGSLDFTKARRRLLRSIFDILWSRNLLLKSRRMVKAKLPKILRRFSLKPLYSVLGSCWKTPLPLLDVSKGC